MRAPGQSCLHLAQGLPHSTSLHLAPTHNTSWNLGGTILSALFVYAAGRRHGDTLKRIGQRAYYQRRLQAGLRRLVAWREARAKAKKAQKTVEDYARRRGKVHSLEKWRAACEWRSWTTEVRGAGKRTLERKARSEIDCSKKLNPNTPTPNSRMSHTRFSWRVRRRVDLD